MPRPKKTIKLSLDDLNSRINQAHERGRTQGALHERKLIDEDVRKRTVEANLKALNAAGQLVQSMSAAVEALCRAMYDGRGM